MPLQKLFRSTKEGSMYIAILDDVDDSALASDAPFPSPVIKRYSAKPRSLWQGVLILTFTVSVVINVILLVTLHRAANDERRNGTFCARQAMLYSSPLLDEISLERSTVQWNGSFYRPNIYRQDPSPEVDQAWRDLGSDDGVVAIPAAVGPSYGLQLHVHARLAPESPHGGSFVGAVQSMHHMHCLNMLRQTTFFNAPYYRERRLGPFADTDATVRFHATHCLDMLRQYVMCNGDLDLSGQLWVNRSAVPQEAPFAFFDFNTRHKCRDWSQITAWREARRLPQDEQVMIYPGDIVLDDFP